MICRLIGDFADLPGHAFLGRRSSAALLGCALLERRSLSMLIPLQDVTCPSTDARKQAVLRTTYRNKQSCPSQYPVCTCRGRSQEDS